MLREVIQADTGIIFNRNKLMKFGVPGTEFAPTMQGGSAITPRTKGADHPQQPSVSTGSQAVSRQEGDVKASHEMTATETSTTLASEESDAPWWYRDSIEPLRDELLHQPGWWLLEVLPFYVKKQDENSVWKKHIRYISSSSPLEASSRLNSSSWLAASIASDLASFPNRLMRTIRTTYVVISIAVLCS